MRSPFASRLAPLAALLVCVTGTAAEFDLIAALRAAAPGATVLVPPGVYPAPIVIDKPLTLLAQPGAVVDGGGRGDLLHVNAPDVTVRGLTLRGSGDSLDRENAGLVVAAQRATIEGVQLEDVLLGILLRDADDARVCNNSIRGKPLDPGRRGDAIRLWNSHDVLVEGNRIDGARDVVIWYSRGATLRNNSVQNCRYGLHFMYASDSLLEGNRLTDNSVGVFLMYSHDVAIRRNVLARNRGPSGYGVGLKDMDAVTIEQNLISANRVGIYFDNSPQRLDSYGDVRANVLAYNDVGLAFLPSVKRNRIVENALIENIQQVAVLSSGDFCGNEFALDGRGNYWSDYAGFDGNRDGRGDLAYQPVSLFENLMDREPKLRLFLYSPAQQAVEFAARAFPIMKPEPRISDPYPLMSPPAIEVPVVAQTGGGSLSLLGLALLGGAATLLPRGRFRVVRPEASNPSSASAARRPGEAPQHHSNEDVTPHADGGPLCAQPGASASAQTTAVTSGPLQPVLRVRGLRKSFGRYAAVSDFAVDIWSGQAVALWGANGAGKTTVIKCLLGLHTCRGTIEVRGLDARRYGKRARRLIGYVSQELAFYDDLTALEIVRLFARLKRVNIARGQDVLRQVGLEEHAHKRVANLSGGMKQRLALAVALLSDPPLLLLDEPTSNLDAAARRQFLGLLAELRQSGKTILFTTHRPEEVAQLADRLVILERGQTRYDGKPDALERNRDAQITLRIPLPAERRPGAALALQQAGYAASLNHTALLVRVSATRKAEPISALARAGFEVSDFNVESEAADER